MSLDMTARYKAWRKRRADRAKEIAARDPLTQWVENLPPVDRRAVPNRRRRKASPA